MELNPAGLSAAYQQGLSVETAQRFQSDPLAGMLVMDTDRAGASAEAAALDAVNRAVV
jgi:hypothetical protein